MRGSFGRHSIIQRGIREREENQISPRRFSNGFGVEELVRRLDIYKKIHIPREEYVFDEGLVFMRFNKNGDIIMSADEDDGTIMLWNWEAGVANFSFLSGHTCTKTYFDAKMINDGTIISCAGDGQVRLTEIGEGGEVNTVILASQEVHTATTLAIDPESPHIFYSCGYPGLVQLILGRFSSKLWSSFPVGCCE